MISSRKLEDLTIEVAVLAVKFEEECKKQLGIDILITSTYRDAECQNSLYAQGRTAPGKIVTNAQAGQSWHNFRRAFDFCPLINGKPNWDDIELYTKCGEIAESLGLEWAGRWEHFQEYAHCQLTGGRTLAQMWAEMGTS